MLCFLHSAAQWSVKKSFYFLPQRAQSLPQRTQRKQTDTFAHFAVKMKM